VIHTSPLKLKASDDLNYWDEGYHMRRRRRVIGLILLFSCVSACSREGRTQQERIAIELRDAAVRCLTDVRDHDSKYENSQHCRSLSRLAQQYIEAGGFKDSASTQANRIAEGARARAWMALAISKTGDKRLNIW
jgi:hypothetical protein